MRLVLLFLMCLVAAPLGAQSVPDATLRRELDSVRAVQTATSRYCGTASATSYMRTACATLNGVVTRLSAALAPVAPPPVVTGPHADFRISQTPRLDTLDARISTAGSAPIVSYAWHASNPSRPDRTGAVILRADPETYQERLIVTDANGRADTVTKTVVIPAAYDSTASVQVLLSQPHAVVGDTVIVCGVFTTRSGAKGLLLFNSDSISNQSSVATLAPATSATQCLPLLQAAGIVLTPSLAPRVARWTVKP